MEKNTTQKNVSRISYYSLARAHIHTHIFFVVVFKLFFPFLSFVFFYFLQVCSGLQTYPVLPRLFYIFSNLPCVIIVFFRCLFCFVRVSCIGWLRCFPRIMQAVCPSEWVACGHRKQAYPSVFVPPCFFVDNFLLCVRH